MRFEKSKSTEKIYFVIMANVFHTVREIHERFDLKGSTVGRITKSNDPSIAKKDLNIIQDKEHVCLPPETTELLLSILEKDSEFFRQNNIIDYSLLIGIHHVPKENTQNRNTDILNIIFS
jgi:1-phosphatidylinositol-4-phosphate 5-kinase